MTLPADFWENERRFLAAVIRQKLAGAAVLGVMDAERKLSGFGLYFDNALAHVEAQRWARQHTDELLSQFGTTTQRGVGEILQTWMQTPGATMGDLERSLQPFLDGNLARASLTAVTETTRAFAAGNDLAYQAVGIQPMLYKPPLHTNCRCDTAVKLVKSSNTWVTVWLTNNDELVCTRPVNTGTALGTVDGCRGMHNRIISAGPYFGKKFSDA